MLPVHVALTSLTSAAPPEQLHHVGAALQTQATRDVGPLWSIDATLDVFGSLSEIPAGYWPLVVVDETKVERSVHYASDGQPMAFVKHNASWSLAASHEMVEMVIDPWGSRVTPGRSPKPEQGQVEFLVEACDPCEAPEFAYTIDGVLVSDFVTPRFYDPAQTRGAQYSYTGSLDGPRQILPGGYLSWRDPQTGEIWQSRWFEGDEPGFECLGVSDFSQIGSMRAWVDRQTSDPGLDAGLAAEDPILDRARKRWAAATQTAVAHGNQLEQDIARLEATASD